MWSHRKMAILRRKHKGHPGGIMSFPKVLTSFSRILTSFQRVLTSFPGVLTSFLYPARDPVTARNV
jgi:hypothetical protein